MIIVAKLLGEHYAYVTIDGHNGLSLDLERWWGKVKVTPHQVGTFRGAVFVPTQDLKRWLFNDIKHALRWDGIEGWENLAFDEGIDAVVSMFKEMDRKYPPCG